MSRQRIPESNAKASEDLDKMSRVKLEERVENLSRELVAALLRLKQERVKWNEAPKESDEVFQQFFDQNEEALLVFQPDTCLIIDANPAAEGLFGYSKKELIEKGPSLFVDPEELLNFSQIISRMDMSEDTRILTYKKRDDSKGMLSFRVRVIRLRERNVVFLSFRDITEEIRSKGEARLRQAQLIYTNKMASLGLLVTSVAQEINNSNNPVMYNAQLISDAWRDALPILDRYYRETGDFPLGGPLLLFSEMREVVPKILAEVMDNASRIRRIVDNLGDFVREDKAWLDKDVDVNRVMRHAVSILGDQIHKHAERIHLDLGEDVPAVRGNSQKLEQVFINLIMNALHALPNKNCGIWVSTHFRRDKSAVEIKVRDEGIGMSKDVLSRLTEPFFSTKLDSGGSGLGLYISHSIVKEHRGSMEFESDLGKGTTVTVSIPQANARRQSAKHL